MSAKKYFSILFTVLMCLSVMSIGAFAAQACPHSFSDWVLTVVPTCDDYGKYTRTCFICNTTEERSVEPTDHNWNEGVIESESTCVTQGKRTYTCKNNANHQHTVLLPLNKDAHIKETYKLREVKAGCTTKGFSGDVYCAGCNEKISDGVETEAIGTHTFEEFPPYSEDRAVSYVFGGKNITISVSDITVGEHAVLNKYFRFHPWQIKALEPLDVFDPSAKGVLALPIPKDYNTEKVKVLKLDFENDSYSEIAIREIKDGFAYVNTDVLGAFAIAETTYMWEITHDATLFEAGVKRLQCRRCNSYKIEPVAKLKAFVAEDIFSGIAITYPKEYFGNQLVDLSVNDVYLGEHALTKQYSQIYVKEVKAVAARNTVKPSGEILIRIPIPSDFDKENVEIYYLNTEDGSHTPVAITNDIIEDGYVEMVVSYLGIFAAVDKTSENPYLDCTCLCHQRGLLNIIYRVIMKIQQFFGINPVCECGNVHYVKTNESIFDKLFPNGVIPPVK